MVVKIDVHGVVANVSSTAVAALRDAAASDAGRSSARRDLSLVLTHALQTGKRVALRRAEARELALLIAENPGLSGLETLETLLRKVA